MQQTNIQCTVYSVQFTLCSVQRTVYCVKCTVPYSAVPYSTVECCSPSAAALQGSGCVGPIHSTAHGCLPAPNTVQGTVYTVHCTLYTCTLYSVHCALYSVHLYSVQCALYTLQCTVYSVQCTVGGARACGEASSRRRKRQQWWGDGCGGRWRGHRLLWGTVERESLTLVGDSGERDYCGVGGEGELDSRGETLVGPGG